MNFIIALIISAVVLFLLIFVFLLATRNKQWAKDLYASKLDNADSFNKKTFVSDEFKNKDEWQMINFHDKDIPFLQLLAPRGEASKTSEILQNNSRIDKISSDYETSKSYNMSFGGVTPILLICHGAGGSIENSYLEFKHIANFTGMTVVCLEYPGFGQRKKSSRSTEYNMLQVYPLEIKHLIENHLKISWDNVVLLGQCLGAVIACSIVKNLKLSNLKHLILTKPLMSTSDATKNLAGRFMASILPNIFDINPYLSGIWCDVTCIQGDTDELCILDDTKKMLAKMENAKNVKLITVPGVLHNLRMFKAILLWKGTKVP